MYTEDYLGHSPPPPAPEQPGLLTRALARFRAATRRPQLAVAPTEPPST
jgi:hypothetical protein